MMKLVAILLAAAIPPAIYFTTLGPKRQRDLTAARAQLAELDMRIESAKMAQRKLPQLASDVLPESLAIDDIRTMTQSLAAENALQVTKFDAGTPTTGNALQQQTMSVEVAGSAEGTAAFLRQLGQTSRIIHVSGVTCTKDPAGWRTAFQMTTYAMR